MGSALYDFRPHDKPIIRVEWAPYKKGKLLNKALPDLRPICPMSSMLPAPVSPARPSVSCQ